jgi:hypothetical protein
MPIEQKSKAVESRGSRVERQGSTSPRSIDSIVNSNLVFRIRESTHKMTDLMNRQAFVIQLFCGWQNLLVYLRFFCPNLKNFNLCANDH